MSEQGLDRPTPIAIDLSPHERVAVRALAESPETPGRIATRARIVLGLADGEKPTPLSKALGVSLPTVALWRRRFADAGILGLEDRREVEAGTELQRLLDAAETTLSRRGFCATRVADIAEEAGVSPAAVIYHFGTREDVLVRSMLHASEKAAVAFEGDIAAAQGDPLVTMATLMRRLVPHAGSQRNEFVLELDLLAHTRQHEALLAMWESYQDRWVGALAEVIEGGVAAGVFAARQRPVDVSAAILALVDGLGYQIAIGSGRMTLERMQSIVCTVAANELGIEPAALGLGSRNPSL